MCGRSFTPHGGRVDASHISRAASSMISGVSGRPPSIMTPVSLGSPFGRVIPKNDSASRSARRSASSSGGYAGSSADNFVRPLAVTGPADAFLFALSHQPLKRRANDSRTRAVVVFDVEFSIVIVTVRNLNVERERASDLYDLHRWHPLLQRFNGRDRRELAELQIPERERRARVVFLAGTRTACVQPMADAVTGVGRVVVSHAPPPASSRQPAG